MDARQTLGAGKSPVPREIHSDCPDLHPPTSAEQVYHDYALRVYSMARRMVATEADAEDVTQEVLLQVVRKLPSFRGDSAFPTWLHRVTVNAALSHRRRQAVREEHGLCNSLEAIGADEPYETAGHRSTPPPDDLMVSSETRQLIDRAIASLPGAYRDVFVLADVEGMANAEIGERLSLSLPAVKSRLHRARAMLRERLAPHFEEAEV